MRYKCFKIKGSNEKEPPRPNPVPRVNNPG